MSEVSAGAAGEYAPCPLCKQYSHSIGCDSVAAALNHFHMMVAHPVRGHPMGHAFDEQTRDAAQVMMSLRTPEPAGDLVETVARALCVAGHSGFNPDEIMPNDGPRWRYYAPSARAAIAAIKDTQP